MRRITLWLLSTIAALALLFSYRTSTMGAGGQSTAVVADVPPAAAGGTSGGGDTGNGSYDGSVAQTRWGPVQVRITVTNGKITEVSAIQYPDGNREDQQINAYALPTLRARVLQA